MAASPESRSRPSVPPRSLSGVREVRRRNRPINSCFECRQRKIKCDRLATCSSCAALRVECLYLTPADNKVRRRKLAEMKDRMNALERNLEREVVSERLGSIKREASSTAGDPAGDEDGEFSNDEENALEPTPLAALDNVYENVYETNVNVNDELMDLGVQMGKMRISERIGGYIRPKLVDELYDSLADVKSNKSKEAMTPCGDEQQSWQAAAQSLRAAPISYIGPGPDYIAPSSTFFFLGPGSAGSLMDHLPSKNASDILIAQYWNAVHYMCKIVHRPSFEAQYRVFWATIHTGTEPVAPLQAIMFAAMFSAAVSMTEEQTLHFFAESRAVLIDRLRSGAEMALAKANFLRTTKIDTIQAFTMYLIPFVRAEISRAHSVLVGSAIRLAECMGLHRDGTLYQMGVIEVQVRRMIWHQLCFLDIRTCEATGPRPQIRREDYDTKMPWNVNDDDLLGPNPVVKDKEEWTDMTFMRLRAECMEMRRQVFFDIIAVDKKTKSLTSLLVKIQKFRTSLEEKYLPWLDASVPLHSLARLVFELGTRSLHLQTLHRYLFNMKQQMPDRLRQVLIEAGLAQMESAIALETTPSLQPWVWYKGAFNQYHSALLLLVEVCNYPMRKDAVRIWACLDYIFEIPPHLAPKEKAELVVSDLAARMTVYQNMRKLKAPTLMEERLGTGSKSSLRINTASTALSNLDGVIDANGQMFQKQATMPMGFSPPPNEATEGESSGSQNGDNPMLRAGFEAVMQDIDWVRGIPFCS
ncbi:uncharacterized protein K489DRAFT_314473 [Dissoconium aciculare CBS 342.82]|uniref:Zn(2)-C6 fungal-type domain-containing protein n=1 Tax=Dissoconium aciculare CBS 342.82 TaxID=1314786 RepID=A0A6J3MAI4_9PEZI|nr:uncharacterized protein K489DRAFT_314473 [Dissoconium aciculare CBS 342.82]KAF1824873.1 hypothetical protein K489DRAFT_314473 [Dissoconium aciculare CBS 342.82]